MSLKEELFGRLREAVVSGDPDEVVKLCRRVVEAGVDPLEAIERGSCSCYFRIG